MLGLRYTFLNQKRTLAAYSTKFKIIPEQAESFFLQGTTAHGRGDFIEAEKLYKKTIKFDPQLVRAHLNLAILHHETGQSSNAKKILSKALKLTDLDPAMKGRLAKSLGQVLQEEKNSSLAIKYYHQALIHLPEDPEILDNMATSLLATGKGERALEYLRKVINLNPGASKPFINLGHALHDLNKDEDAIETFNMALKYEPTCVEALVGLGVSLSHHKRDVGQLIST
eukprot:TRINITY_DN7504_c0_g1_i2.p1 TRINITY_DN7504_c0_g1~~TRINITY_DN7504_c0_g1_i2.p1  ORF type:complete len:227 (+),score=45.73 TRINITY_DN7504_c0_g1_i2:85-765(+)